MRKTSYDQMLAIICNNAMDLLAESNEKYVDTDLYNVHLYRVGTIAMRLGYNKFIDKYEMANGYHKKGLYKLSEADEFRVRLFSMGDWPALANPQAFHLTKAVLNANHPHKYMDMSKEIQGFVAKRLETEISYEYETWADYVKCQQECIIRFGTKYSDEVMKIGFTRPQIQETADGTWVISDGSAKLPNKFWLPLSKTNSWIEDRQ